ncbi:MAG: hypothetical protein RMY36_030735 [Nostoc sp. SerVER01]|nr:hypothetical protein [Nostoc sp. SerVER01]
MAIIKIDGQDITIDDAIAQNDEDLKKVIVPFYPQLANAEIKRETTAQGLVVRMIKQAGLKGSDAVIESLKNAPSEFNPAIDLAWRCKQVFFTNSQVELKDVIDLQPQIESALSAGNKENNEIRHSLYFLTHCPSEASNTPIAGF